MFPIPKSKIDDMIAFGKDIQNIPAMCLDKIFEYENPLIGLLVAVNLNSEFPTYHNIYYKDINAEFGKIYANHQWVEMDINEILDVLIETKVRTLKELLRGTGNYMKRDVKDKFKKCIDQIEDASSKIMKKIKMEMKNVLCEHHDIVKKTKIFINQRNYENYCEDVKYIQRLEDICMQYFDKQNLARTHEILAQKIASRKK